MRRIEFLPGVFVSGTVHRLGSRRELSNLRVSGPGTPDGNLRIGRKTITGVLGGRPVRSRVPGAAPRPRRLPPARRWTATSWCARCSASPSDRDCADVRLAAALIAAAAVVAAARPSGPRGAHFERCGAFLFQCARLSVPLDRSGATPGRVVAVREADQGAAAPAAAGALFVLAGGPGQSATQAFEGDGLGVLSPAFRHRDLIVFDQRGTGRSGLLRCRALERSNLFDAGRAAGACAQAARRAPLPLHEPRLGRGHRGPARGARHRPDRPLRHLVRREGRARLRAHLSRPRGAPRAGLGARRGRPRPVLRRRRSRRSRACCARSAGRAAPRSPPTRSRTCAGSCAGWGRAGCAARSWTSAGAGARPASAAASCS